MPLYGIRTPDEVQEILAIATRFKEIEMIRVKARIRASLRATRAARRRTKQQPSLEARLIAYKAQKRADEKKQAIKAARKAGRAIIKNSLWSNEKQRRSRVNWRDIVPEDIAEAQEYWERRHTVYALREKTGMTYAAIGALFGRSQENIRQKIEKVKRERRCGRRSPVERWMDAPVSTNPREAKRLLQQVSSIPGARDWLHV